VKHHTSKIYPTEKPAYYSITHNQSRKQVLKILTVHKTRHKTIPR